jgi:hypothetical protein
MMHGIPHSAGEPSRPAIAAQQRAWTEVLAIVGHCCMAHGGGGTSLRGALRAAHVHDSIQDNMKRKLATASTALPEVSMFELSCECGRGFCKRGTCTSEWKTAGQCWVVGEVSAPTERTDRDDRRSAAHTTLSD